jgi:hypothetical protein
MNRRIAVLGLGVLSFIAVHPAVGLTVGEARGPLGEDRIRQMVEVAPQEAAFPDAEALILFDGTYITYQNGMASVRRQRLIKVYTEYAIDELGDPRLAYDRGRQDLSIQASRTYLLDGSAVDTPENGYNEVTPFGLDLSVEQLDMREMVVTHVGMERGVSILLDWTVSDRAPAGIPFNRLCMLYDDFPALEKEVIAEGELYGESAGSPEGNLSNLGPDREGGKLVWHFTDLPQRPMHADGRLGDQVPWIAVASVPTWENLLAKVGEACMSAAAIRHRLEQILGDMEEESPFLSDRQYLERAVEAIAERTELVRYRPWLTAPEPAGVDTCLIYSTATPIDRCAMVLAACIARGLRPEVGFPARWSSLTRHVPALEALGDPVVRVTGLHGDVTVWADPAEGTVTAQAPFAGGLPYFAIADDGPTRCTNPVVPNHIVLSVFWDLETGEAEADGSIEGPVTSGLAWDEPERLLREWAEAWADSAAAGEVRVLNSGPEVITYLVKLHAPLPSKDDRGRTPVELPMPPCGIGVLLAPGLDPARSAIDGILFPSAPVVVDLVWSLRLPQAYKLLPARDLDTVVEGGALTVRRTANGNLVTLAHHFEWDGRPISNEDYPGYRQLALGLTDRRLVTPMLVEKGPEEPQG